MAERKVEYLLIGGGMASAHAAAELRKRGADGEVLLAGRETEIPYERPPLTKEYMRGEAERSDAHVHPADWYEENGVELLTGTNVMSLDPDQRSAKLQGGDEVSFEKALIATGANVNILRVEGAENEGIHYLRAFGNSDAIRADADASERAVLIGGSYIGCEVAASLTAAHGVKCSIVMQEEVTLERQFGKQIGRFFQDTLEQHGVEVHGGDELERFEGSDGRVSKVVTREGRELDCDMVVVGIGVMPDVTLARSAGLELGETGGMKCSAGLETSVSGIYAAGDICEYESTVHGARLRLEHWDVAFNQGKTAALNMLGRGVEHDVVPYFFSDLADWASFEYVGPGSGDLVVRGSLEQGDFTAFFVHEEEGHVVSALTVGRSDDLEHARRFIAERTKPEPGALADESSDLSEL
jgi:3-phenylpropionate/trans-cinnamate dioxygenase ferredoxin reductase component